MHQIAKENNVLLLEAIWTAFLPTMIKAREWIKSGQIGDIILVDSFFAINYPHVERIFDIKLGGGVLYDIGIYNLAVNRMIMNKEHSSYSFD